MTLTTAQILDLAPDAASRKAGQTQAKPAQWSGLGRAGTVIWGEIQGSGASPYRTVADLAGPASKCTCPSRKFPCKHALGLMLVEAAAPIAVGTPPDWVEAWVRGRETRAASAEARAPGKPVDEAAQAKRRQVRDDRVAAALEELDLWLRDLMRRGLASARAEPYAFWDRMAGRLVDGQVPGLARRVRALPGLAATAAQPGAPRPDAALGLALGRLALLLAAARRREALDPEQAAGVGAALGLPVTAEAMAARPDRADTWAVLAHGVEAEGGLTARSVWLAGRASGALAQVIDYGAAGSPLPPVPVAGQDFHGALAFHPGDPPLRALFREGRAEAAAAPVLPGGGTVAAARDAFAAVLARAPWTESWPVCLAGVRLGRLAARAGVAETTPAFAVGDATGCLALRADPRLPGLLAVAGGRVVDLFGLYDGHGLVPLAVFAEGRVFAVPAQEPLPILMRVA
ncbi:SWIM zinc finger family protein [Methylobacterium gossipiicola]|uniref:SWIM zinc finger n=1 Tax=Methylobacterium gossipiicola TaxID=582675 RepID=A0A1I2RWE7_9HYPH|nr:SWIM zinc finger family protein [Methylobacterium gossipiicola]SFG45015.1 SWIM zinc finger [Methylobacterium gossipiicola]